MKNKQFFKEILILILPFLVWLFLRRGFLTGEFFLLGDNQQYYYWTTYYLDNIVRGVYPLWNPFFAWGSIDNFDMRSIGEFNPFLYFIPLFNHLGIPLYFSFIIYMFIYYFVGLVGFFLLVRRLLNIRLAYLAFVLLMFSSLGVAIFQQLQILLLYVPAMWFFFFFVGFAQTTQKKYLLGMTFSLMLIATTYLPFYFMTIFLSFMVLFILLYFRESLKIFQQWVRFFKKDKLTVAFCALGLSLSLIPPLMWYMEAQDSQYVMDIKRHGSSDKHTATLSLEGISYSSITTEASLVEVFSDLDLGNLQFSYVSLFVYLLLLLSIINKGNKRQALLLGTGFLVFLIVLTNVTPFHAFLYHHIFFFKLFRNYFYFLPFLIPILILFSMEQFQLFLNRAHCHAKQKIFIVLFILIAHLAFAIFLYKQGHILWSSYATVIGSFILFTLYFMDRIHPKNIIFMFIVLAIALIEPLEANLYFKHLFGTTPLVQSDIHRPVFSFKRPLKGQGKDIESGFYGRTKLMQDMSGFVDEEYLGVYWSHLLHKKANHSILKNYVQHKFLVYDHVEFVQDSNFDLKRIERAWTDAKNVAFIFDEPVDQPISHSTDKTRDKVLIINKDVAPFKILKFDLNSIKFKTHFKSKKFLVYNDSYHTGWRASVNGKKAKIFRSNVAFKGIWLEPGENTILLSYGNPYLHGLYRFLVLFFVVFLFYLIITFVKDSPYDNKSVS